MLNTTTGYGSGKSYVWEHFVYISLFYYMFNNQNDIEVDTKLVLSNHKNNPQKSNVCVFRYKGHPSALLLLDKLWLEIFVIRKQLLRVFLGIINLC